MPEDVSPPLRSLIAHARSATPDRAGELLRETGLDCLHDDPVVLSGHGRLLKDRALATRGAEERRQFYLESARAYARAGEIDGTTYPLINAATLWLLARDRSQARSLAQEVIERIARAEDKSESPYWRAATRAEALLLLGETGKAEASLKEAIALAPRSFHDHAATLRQLGLILDELGEDGFWLDAFRPPRSLHFAGHMAVSPGGRAVVAKIRAMIRKEHIGFGYGALAAGADLLIAEALLEEGTELHVILPGAEEHFREVSMARFGQGWARRFDRIVRDATTVRSVATEDGLLSLPAIRLAAEIAMGAAAMQADALMTEAVQLLVLEQDARFGTDVGISGFICAAWQETDRRQHITTAPRARQHDGTQPAQPAFGSTDCLAAILMIDLSGSSPRELAQSILPRVADAIGTEPAVMPARWMGEGVCAAFDTPSAAARTALSVAAVLDGAANSRIAAHYAVAQRLEDPLGGEPFLAGSAMRLAASALLSTPRGIISLTDDFATALCAGPAKERPRTEYLGDVQAGGAASAPIRIHSLTR